MSSPHVSGAPDRSPGQGEGPAALIGSGWAPSRPPVAEPPRPAAPAGGSPAPAPGTPSDVTSASARPAAGAEPREPRDEPAGQPRRAEQRPEPARGADGAPTTVLPGGGGTSAVRRPPVRPAPGRTPRPADAAARTSAARTRRAKLALQRIDPWSVFLYTLVASVFLGVALLVAVFVLYSVLSALGVPETVNEFYTELTDAQDPLLTSGRVLGATAVLAAVNVVLLTLLATLGALLYNLVSSFTGGIELTLGEREG